MPALFSFNCHLLTFMDLIKLAKFIKEKSRLSDFGYNFPKHVLSSAISCATLCMPNYSCKNIIMDTLYSLFHKVLCQDLWRHGEGATAAQVLQEVP